MSAPLDPALNTADDPVTATDGTSCDLTLFVSGATDLSAHAIADARSLCDNHLAGRYHLSVVDVHEGGLATVLGSGAVFATPTLVKNWPLPARRSVGDLSQTARVLLALDLPLADDGPSSTIIGPAAATSHEAS